MDADTKLVCSWQVGHRDWITARINLLGTFAAVWQIASN